MCITKGSLWVFRGLPHDGQKVILHYFSHFQIHRQWVDDIADTDGAMYCFHLVSNNGIPELITPLPITENIHKYDIRMRRAAELRARFPHKDIEVDDGVRRKTISVCAEFAESCSSSVFRTLSQAVIQ